jgi:hypothetical protein
MTFGCSKVRNGAARVAAAKRQGPFMAGKLITFTAQRSSVTFCVLDATLLSGTFRKIPNAPIR